MVCSGKARGGRGGEEEEGGWGTGCTREEKDEANEGRDAEKVEARGRGLRDACGEVRAGSKGAGDLDSCSGPSG